MPAAAPEIVIVGAGVTGLSCAVALAEAERRVRVVSDRAPADTVSAVAGGLWFPYGTDRSPDTLARARAGYERFEAQGAPLVDYLLLGDAPLWWASALPPGRVRAAWAEELPAGYSAGRICRVPLLESPAELERLAGQAAALGVAFERRRVRDLAGEGPLVVNCAGLGARELCKDQALAGVRGQVAHLRPPAGLAPVCVADDLGPNALAYVLPRADVWVAGGTSEPAEEAGEPDLQVREAILERCGRIAPGLEDAEVVDDRVGLRPVRAGGVRLEAERRPDGGTTIHDYGHGGAGWTLAWGCALEVRALVAGLA